MRHDSFGSFEKLRGDEQSLSGIARERSMMSDPDGPNVAFIAETCLTLFDLTFYAICWFAGLEARPPEARCFKAGKMFY